MTNVPGNDPGGFLQTAAGLLEDGNWEDLLRLTREMPAEGQESAEAWFLKGVACYRLNDFAGAITAAEIALSKQSDTREITEFLASVYMLAGKLENALYHGKLAVTLSPSATFAAWLPEDLQSFGVALRSIQKEPLLVRAARAVREEELVEAVHWLRQHIEFEPSSVLAHSTLGYCLTAAGLYHEAVDALRSSAHALPGDPTILTQLAESLANAGKMPESRAVGALARQLAPDDSTIWIRTQAARLSDPADPLTEIAAAMRHWGERFGAKPEPWVIEPVAIDKPRLTVAYVLGNLGMRQAGEAVAAILSRHQTDAFRVVGFGWGSLNAKPNTKFQKCFETWHDVRDLDPVTFSTMVAAEAVDVLVNLAGIHAPEILSSFGMRMAPVQLSWLGAQAGTGLAAVDGLLTDPVLDPEEAPVPYTERPVRLNGGALPLAVPEDDLPVDKVASEGLTLVANAPLELMTSDTLRLWAQVLLDLPDATLVLQDYAYGHQPIIGQMLDLFGDFGLAHRIDLAAPDDSAQLYRLADLCLPPRIPLSPEDLMQALWQGVPTVVLRGPDRRQRTGASLLASLGLNDLVADTEEDYVRLVRDWAEDDRRRADFRSGVRDRIRSSPALDGRERAQELETAYRTLWDGLLGK